MMLFDTHAHLTDEAFSPDRDQVIQSLRDKAMTGVINCGDNEKSSYLAMVLAKRYDFFYAAVGVHPHDAKDYTDETEEKLRRWLHAPKVVALGEIGLDYYYDYSPRPVQQEVFVRQLKLAQAEDKPVVIHSRDASQDTFDILRRHLAQKRGAVLHSFSQSAQMLRRYLDMNMYFSISGPVTFKNASNLRETVKEIPLDRLLIETDSPYLTPEPNRGKRNSPAYVEFVCRKIAQLRDMRYEALAEITCENALRFFDIPKSK